jgi:large subunit ribosomal protein L21
MKKAVIKTGGKQYLVSEGETLTVDRIKDGAAGGKLSFDALLVVDGEKTQVGTPTVPKAKVAAEIVDAEARAEKVTSIRYKSKKRVRKVRGHRQHQTVIKISKISQAA